MLDIAEVARQCAAHQSPNHPNGTRYGAYVKSKFFSGGFNFESFDDAVIWIKTQERNASRNGNRDDLQACAVDLWTNTAYFIV